MNNLDPELLHGQASYVSGRHKPLHKTLGLRPAPASSPGSPPPVSLRPPLHPPTPPWLPPPPPSAGARQKTTTPLPPPSGVPAPC